MSRIETNNANRRFVVLAIAIAAVGTILLALAAQSRAEMALVPDSFTLETFGEDGTTVDSRAGGHPAEQVTTFRITESSPGILTGRLNDLRVELPVGFVGDNAAVPKCPRARFDQMIQAIGTGVVYCPPASQVGMFILTTDAPLPVKAAVYNVVPQDGVLADLGMVVSSVPVHILVRIDPVTRGLIAESRRTSEGVNVIGSEVRLWGDPGSSRYDMNQRGCGEPFVSFYCPVTIPRKPFITNPSTCGTEAKATFTANSWSEPNRWITDSYTSPEPLHGCDLLVFEPSLEAAPSSPGAEAASGFSVRLKLPQSADPDGLGTPPLKTARVVLPEGMSINPASADGLGACTDAQLGFGTDNPIGCPDSSKLGSATATSPALENPVEGSLYLRTQNSNDPESGEMFRLALVLEDEERGLLIKQPGQIKVNKGTGRIETVFADNPQLPVSSVRLDLKSGPRAALQTPKACGTYATDYVLTSWGGQEVRGQSKFAVSQDCTRKDGFTPGFEAGTTNPVAGKHSAFTLRVTRPDGQQNLASIQTTLPKGVLAKLAGVPLCGDAEAVTGACPAGSQVGTATVGAGAGSNPLYVPQPGRPGTAVYLAGPYKGAPYSLVAMVPAQAGPFDLGTVTVRNTIAVDPLTTQVSVQSDPLPQIVQGIPISYRDVRVDVTRPQFTLNPTSCDPMQVTAALASNGGLVAGASDRFQVAGCERLGFKPKLAFRFSGQMKRAGNPALRAVLTQPKGQANIGKVSVLLPKGQFIDNAHIRNPCTRDQFAREACPKGSILGRATAFSPLLDQPLRGPVYFRANGGARQLPDLVADLRGQIRVELVGFIDSVKSGKEGSRVRTRFLGVPDAPVTKFVLRMQGGKKGLLENSRHLCRSQPRANVRMDGQNGKAHDFAVKVKRSCASK